MRTSRIAPLAFAGLFVSSLPARATIWTVPGAVNASGLNGTKFVSDITLTNPGSAPAQATIAFLPGTAAAQTLALGPGQTVVSRNVVSALFGLSGAGALQISSDQPLLVRARTYNTAASGTYGVSLPVVADDRLLGPGDRGDSLWISQDASGSSGFRTNVAVVFPDAGGGAATVTVYDADGVQRGHQDFSLDAAGLQQFSVGSFAGAVAVARADLVVTRGHAAGYAVVVDNITGDSSLFSFEDLPGGWQDVLVNGVARANGRNAAFFRTDGRFYNPTDTDATVRVSFHANQSANPSPQTALFVLPAGKVRDVVDVLDSLLGLPVGSAGALRFQSNWPVAILCRTSNVDPSGARPGTFGSQQKPVPLLSFLTSADAGAAITGIRQDAAYRTNVGFAAGADGASYTLTLQDASGTTVATTSASLGALGWTQPGIQDLFPTVTVPADATLRVKVTAGSLDVFDSSIDNLSGDPVVTPIAPLPASIPSSATIGPAGGSIRSDDGRLTLRVPAGALPSPVSVSFQTTTNGAPQGTGPGYQLSPSGLTFAKLALLTLAYARGDTESSSAEALAIASRSGADWHVFGGGTVDPARHTLTVPLLTTSPAAARVTQARAAAADTSSELAVARSWMLVKSGRQTVLTDGRLNFSVYAVGPPSSRSIVDFVTGTLSNSPYQVDAGWYVNGIRDGNAEYGTILHEPGGGNVSVVYAAPACAPLENPVSVNALVMNTGGFLRHVYQVPGVAWVRVVSRVWRLNVEPDFTVRCDDGRTNVSDSVEWDDAHPIEFTLDEDFSASFNVDTPTPSDDVQPCPRMCPSGWTAKKKTEGSLAQLSIRAAVRWDREIDKMRLDAFLIWLGHPGLDYVCSKANFGDVDVNLSGEPSFTVLDAAELVPEALTYGALFDAEPGKVHTFYRLHAVCR